jgi:hypothetical protein
LFVDFSLPTKPPSTYNVPTNKEFNLVGVIVQTFDHEGFALPNQNVITSYMQTRFNSRGKNVVKISKIMSMGANVPMHMKSNHHVDTTKEARFDLPIGICIIS